MLHPPAAGRRAQRTARNLNTTSLVLVDESSGNTLTLSPGLLTGDRIFTLPDASGTFALSGNATVTTGATLTGDGSIGTPLSINLANANTWTANQTFAGASTIVQNGNLTMANTDNNARDIRRQEPSSSGTQYVGLRAPGLTTSINYVFPNLMGTVGQALTLATVTGSGSSDSATLTWANPAVSGSAGGDRTGSYPNPTIAGLAVSTAKLADSAVTGVKLATNAVRTAHISNGEVTPSKISSTGAANGNALVYNGLSVAWGQPLTKLVRVGIDDNDSPYIVPVGTEIVGVDVSGGAVTVTLPSAASSGSGAIVVIKNEAGNAATNAITIQRSGTDLINASSTSISITFGTATGSFRLYSDGVSRWHQW